MDFVEKEPEAKNEPQAEASIETVKEMKPVIHQLTDDEKDIEVNDEVEIIPITKSTSNGEVRYALDDYELEESSINKVAETTSKDNDVEVDADLNMFVKGSSEDNSVLSEDSDADTSDPLNLPISELLKSRADERRKKMKAFNYKFNNQKIDDIEKIPAYKRQGLDLEEGQHSSDLNSSRTMLGTDDNNDIQLRSNNSFLHDNVD